MNRLDKEIMMALLSSQQSMYGVEKSLKASNYATVYRHIKRMQKDALLSATQVSRKNGKHDKRGTEKPELTAKGLATLIIDGDLQKEELTVAVRRFLQKNYSDLPASFLPDTYADEIFANTLLKMRPKVNLRFFDEIYFNQAFSISFAESLFEKIDKFNFRKDSGSQARAKMLREKYVTTQTIENLKNLQNLFVQERNKFNRYAEALGTLLQAISEKRD